jgi:glutathione synthase/RimK-type ligase-like ATP-grasp enzyme
MTSSVPSTRWFERAITSRSAGRSENGPRSGSTSWTGRVRSGSGTRCGFGFPAKMDSQVRRWAEREARFGFGGLLATLPGWLNHPHHIGYAEYKPVQLQTAVAAGLTVPPTLITNRAGAAQQFAEQVGPVVYKALHGGGITEVGQWKSPYATPVTAAEIADTSVELTAHVFQQLQPKAYEVRLTVVDEAMFPAEIHAGSDAAKVDWRRDYGSLVYRAGAVPDAVSHAVCRMMTRLGLRFGAFDFVVTPTEEWVFLELNPNGQWAWLQDETGLPIAQAIADALEGGIA